MTLLEFVAHAIDRFASRLGSSRWLPLTVLAVLSFSLFYGFGVLLQIYSMHPVIVFVPIPAASPH